EVSPAQDKFIRDFFVQKVSPALVTIMLYDDVEFPMLKDTVAYLVVQMRMRKEDKTFPSKKVYALIEIPKTVERFVVLPNEGDKQFIILLDDLIRYCLHNIFNIFNYESISAHMIKITRDAELDIDNDL